MALVLDDRVKETSTTTGTGTLNLSGAVSGFQTSLQALVMAIRHTMPLLTVMKRNGKLDLEP